MPVNNLLHYFITLNLQKIKMKRRKFYALLLNDNRIYLYYSRVNKKRLAYKPFLYSDKNYINSSDIVASLPELT